MEITLRFTFLQFSAPLSASARMQRSSSEPRCFAPVHSAPVPSAPEPALEPPSGDHLQNPFPRNCGSLGHPHLCYRRCVHFAQGECTAGRSCEFCHGPHPRERKLTREDRLLLRSITLLDLLRVAWRLLEEHIWVRLEEARQRGEQPGGSSGLHA